MGEEECTVERIVGKVLWIDAYSRSDSDVDAVDGHPVDRPTLQSTVAASHENRKPGGTVSEALGGRIEIIGGPVHPSKSGHHSQTADERKFARRNLRYQSRQGTHEPVGRAIRLTNEQDLTRHGRAPRD